MARDNRGLTPKQALFVAEYFRDFNGTQALVRAGYSPIGANKQVARMLSKPVIAQAIQQKRQEHLAGVDAAAFASLTEIKARLAVQLRGCEAEARLAEMEASLSSRASTLTEWQKFTCRIEIERLRVTRDVEAGRAAVTLARLKGAFDPARKPIPDRKAALDALILSIAKATDGPTIEATMSAAGFTDV